MSLCKVSVWALAMFASASVGTSVGCSNKNSSSTVTQVGSGSSVGSGGSSAPVAQRQVCVSLADPAKPICLSEAEVASWPRLDMLLPQNARRLGTWKSIVVEGGGGKAELTQPSDTYPDLVPALFPTEKGIGFGMFDLVELQTKGQPKWKQEGVSTVRIAIAMGEGRGENDDGSGVTADLSALTLTITTAAGDKVLRGTDIVKIPRQPAPGETGDGKGWALATLLELAGVKAPVKVRLTDSVGVNLVVEKSDFDPATSIPFVKLNKQGALRFRVFKKKGDGWARGADLRALTKVEVLK